MISVFRIARSYYIVIRAYNKFSSYIYLVRIYKYIASVFFRNPSSRIRYLTKRSSPYIAKSLMLKLGLIKYSYR